MDNLNSNIVNNMLIHYSALMKEGVKDFGGDYTSISIFHSVDTDGDGKLSKAEIEEAKKGLTDCIKKEVQKCNFYAEHFFSEEYTENLKHINKSSNKSASEQIVQNNLNKAIAMIFEYVKNNPDDLVVQKYANKLRELISDGRIKLVDISEQGVAGLAVKDKNGKDEILIENHDSVRHLSVNYLLQTLLHELRHSMETDYVNSKAEELEAEQASRELQKKISGKDIYNGNINNFLKGYDGYAEASPGTYQIPQNTGIAVWYKPLEVAMDENNKLVIKSDLQKEMGDVYIEDHVQFGDKKDVEGNPLPISAKCIIKDSDGNVVHEYDYGKYNEKLRRFNYIRVRLKQIALKHQSGIKTAYGH